MICNRMMMMMIRREGIMMTGHQQAPGKSCTPCFCLKVSCPTLESDTRGYFFQLQLVLCIFLKPSSKFADLEENNPFVA